MPRRSKEFYRRSRAAKKGWITRRQRYGPSGRKPVDLGYYDEPDDDYVDVIGIDSVYE